MTWHAQHGVGEGRDDIEDFGEAGGEPVIGLLLAAPGVPAVLGEVGVAHQGIGQRLRGDVAVRGHLPRAARRSSAS